MIVLNFTQLNIAAWIYIALILVAIAVNLIWWGHPKDPDKFGGFWRTLFLMAQLAVLLLALRVI